MKLLNEQDVIFEPSSLADPVGRLFRFDGEIYRSIRKDHADFYSALIRRGSLDKLYEKGLVRAEIAPFSISGSGLVLKHERVPVTSYCVEWPMEMLRDAALITCDLSIDLHRQGLSLRDAHPWNVLFEFGKAKFVDWGSIYTATEKAVWPYKQFRDRFLFPLYLMSAQKAWLARSWMLDVSRQPTFSDIARLTIGRQPLKSWLRGLLFEIELRGNRYVSDSIETLEKLRDLVASIPGRMERTEWSSYKGPVDKDLDDPSRWSTKTENVIDTVIKLSPSTVLDVGSNRGWYAKAVERNVSCNVISTDIDEINVNHLYREIRNTDTRILSLLLDVTMPTPVHGIGEVYKGAKERLRSDLVMALAVTHHLVFKRGMSFRAIAEEFSSYASRWLIVEFVPSDDEHVKKWVEERHDWYTLEKFKHELSRYFRKIEILDSVPSPRQLLVCTK